MKNPTWDEARPHSKAELKAELDRLTHEIQQTLSEVGQTQARTARSREVTQRNLRWIQEKLNAGKIS